MNKIMIIGNLTRDPELRTIPNGTPVCTFTVAVNRRRSDSTGQEADFFRVTAWRKQAESCNQYLAKGKKVAVIGSVSANAYTSKSGSAQASLEVTADDVEFLSPVNSSASPVNPSDGFIKVDPDDDPFI